MTRRVAALFSAAVLLIALAAIALAAPLPYVIMSPGGTENVLGSYDGKQVVSIEGHRTYPDIGRLDLTTVRVTNPDFKPRLAALLEAWVDPHQAVIPRDVIYPPDQTVAESDEESRTQMLDSQSAAVVAGLGEAGIDALEIRVEKVTEGAPADGILLAGDFIMSVDGKRLDLTSDAVAAISGHKPGDVVTIGIERNGKPSSVNIKTEAAPADESRARVGVELSDSYNPPFKVNIELGQAIGGPSAGLMFSLSIYDLLTPSSLTNGEHIAGTGEIDAAGNIGSIGSIQQKMVGADRAGATWFLVPADNCREALASDLANDELKLIKVGTLHQARESLEKLADGDTSSLPTCEN